MTCCGSSPSALISNSESGLSFFCFRCDKRQFERHGPRSIEEILATRRATDALERAASMPADAVPLMEGPSAALLWVLVGGLQPEIANDRYGFRWHEKSRRVIIPLERGLLGRAVYGERPKYRLFGSGDTYALQGGRPDVVVVVEDVLSAIAINRAGWPALAVLGTSISPTQAALISAPHVIGWFDSDSAGDRAWVRLRHKMALHPCNLTRIVSEADPKNLPRATLIDLLEKHS